MYNFEAVFFHSSQCKCFKSWLNDLKWSLGINLISQLQIDIKIYITILNALEIG